MTAPFRLLRPASPPACTSSTRPPQRNSLLLLRQNARWRYSRSRSSSIHSARVCQPPCHAPRSLDGPSTLRGPHPKALSAAEPTLPKLPHYEEEKPYHDTFKEYGRWVRGKGPLCCSMTRTERATRVDEELRTKLGRMAGAGEVPADADVVAAMLQECVVLRVTKPVVLEPAAAAVQQLASQAVEPGSQGDQHWRQLVSCACALVLLMLLPGSKDMDAVSKAVRGVALRLQELSGIKGMIGCAASVAAWALALLQQGRAMGSELWLAAAWAEAHRVQQQIDCSSCSCSSSSSRSECEAPFPSPDAVERQVALHYHTSRPRVSSYQVATTVLLWRPLLSPGNPATLCERESSVQATPSECAAVFSVLADLCLYEEHLVRALLHQLVQQAESVHGLPVQYQDLMRAVCSTIWAVTVMGPGVVHTHKQDVRDLLRFLQRQWDSDAGRLVLQQQTGALQRLLQAQLELEAFDATPVASGTGHGSGGGIGSSGGGGGANSSQQRPQQSGRSTPDPYDAAGSDSMPLSSILRGSAGNSTAGLLAAMREASRQLRLHPRSATVSRLQHQVKSAVDRLREISLADHNVPEVLSSCMEAPVPELACRTDLLVELHGRCVAVEVDGPPHYMLVARNKKHCALRDGRTRLRDRQLARVLGRDNVLAVPFWEWVGLQGHPGVPQSQERAQEEYLRDRLWYRGCGRVMARCSFTRLVKALAAGEQAPSERKTLGSWLDSYLWALRHEYSLCAVPAGRRRVMRYLEGEVKDWRSSMDTRPLRAGARDEAVRALPARVTRRLRHVAGQLQYEFVTEVRRRGVVVGTGTGTGTAGVCRGVKV